MAVMEALGSIEKKIHAGRLEEARSALEKTPETPGNRADLSYLRAHIREADYDREGALDAYEKTLEEHPDHQGAAFRAGLLCDRYGDDESAIRHYERCTSEVPASVNALVNLAILYEEEGRLTEAQALLTRVLSEHPNHMRARAFLRSVMGSFNIVYDEQTQRDRDRRDAVLDTPVSDFELSVRSRNCLRQMNIASLGDLLRTTEAELLSYKNFGETSLNEIKAMLTQKKLRLGQALEPIEMSDSLPHSPNQGLDSGQLNRPISELELSVRSRKALQRLGITTVEELVVRSESELMAVKNFGQTSLIEIKRQLGALGTSLRKD